MGSKKEELSTITREINLHPAQKPIDLMRKYLRVLTQENDIVLDPFVGSGTTVVACKLGGRDYLGFEIDKRYVELSNQRLSQYNLDVFSKTKIHLGIFPIDAKLNKKTK